MSTYANIFDSVVAEIAFDRQNVGGTCSLGAEQLSRQICGKFKYRSVEHCFIVR